MPGPLPLGMTLVCVVLGAALVAAQQDKCMVRQTEGEMLKSLQDLVKALQEHLENETRSVSDQLATE